MTAFNLLLGACVVAGFWWLAWKVSGWVVRAEEARGRAQQASARRAQWRAERSQRAAGLRGDHRRIG